VAGFAFVADGEAPVSGEPGDRAFDDPAVPAEFLSGFDALAGDARDDPALAEPGTRGRDRPDDFSRSWPWLTPVMSGPGTSGSPPNCAISSCGAN
jgi:hypothetical protein